MINLTVNGEPHEIHGASTLAELLHLLNVPPENLVVELNEEVLQHENYENTVLKEGDQIELVRMVGGG